MGEGYSVRLPERAVLNSCRGKIIKVSETFLGLSGYSEEQILDKSAYDVFNGLLRATADIGAMKPGDGPISCFLFTRELEPIEVIISVEDAAPGETFVIHEKPGPRLYVKFCESERLFNDNRMGICIISAPDLFLLKANDFCLELLEDPFNNIKNSIGRRVTDILPIGLEASARETLEGLIKTKRSYYAEKPSENFRRNNRYFHTSAVIPIIEDDEVKYFMAIFVEITEYIKEKERTQEHKRIIEQQKNQLETIIENMNDALIITDKNLNVLLMNAAARAIYPNPDFINNMADWFKMIRVTDQNGEPVKIDDMPANRAARGERVKNFRVDILGPRGFVNAEYSSAPLYDSDGSIRMIITCSRDVTEQVRNANLANINNEALLKAEMDKNDALKKAIAMKDEFLSLISHEFKTPITVIISAIQAMEYICWDQFSDKARGFIGRIKQNAYRQLRLVNNLLEIKKIDSGQEKLKIGSYDIAFLVSSITDSVQVYAAQKDIRLTFSSKISSKFIGIDDEKFERILLNLLSNAIKFTPKGKSVHVRLSETVLNQREMVCVEVEDEGIGIPEDKQAVIFDKFVQVDSSLARQAEGTGLGLSLVKLFVEALDGVIRLESRVGKGSRFTVYLPSQQPGSPPVDPQLAQKSDNRLIQAVAVEFSDLY